MVEYNVEVTILVCVCNGEKYIQKTLDSIITQTFTNIEILVIDDASTDATASIVLKCSKNESRIRYIRLENNVGLAGARVRGLELSTTDLMVNVDADDILLPEMIESQVKVMASDKNIVAVGTYAYIIGEDNDKIIGTMQIGPTSKEQFDLYYKKNKLLFMSVSAMYSRKHVLEVGGYRVGGFPATSGARLQDCCEDLDMWCRLSDLGAQGKFIIVIDRPLFLYRKHLKSLSNNTIRMQNKMRWIKDCLVMRRSGLSEVPYLDFINNQSLFLKINNMRVDFAACVYKILAFKFFSKNYIQAISLLPFVLILAPKYIYQKIRTQRLK